MDKNFERIVYSYSDMLYRIALHYVRNTAEAQDMVQQCFLKMLENNTVFESTDHEKAWLIRVCINLCKDSLKSSWTKKVSSIQDRDFQSPQYEIDDRFPLLSYIRTLPPNQKAAIYLFYYEDMPVSQVARVMGAKQNTVLSWLRRGRKTLEKLIKEEL